MQEKIKIFVSQPMNGLSDAQIIENRERVKDYITSHKSIIFTKLKNLSNYSEENLLYLDFEIIDNLQMDEERKLTLEYLGFDISAMARADIIIFAQGWENARGCKVEFHVANAYGYPCFFMP